MMRPATFALVLALAGCTGAAGTSPPALPSDDACGASGLQGLVGQQATILDGMRFDAPLRVIRPGMAVTLDYSPNRLNIEIGEDDSIVRVACG